MKPARYMILAPVLLAAIALPTLAQNEKSGDTVIYEDGDIWGFPPEEIEMVPPQMPGGPGGAGGPDRPGGGPGGFERTAPEGAQRPSANPRNFAGTYVTSGATNYELYELKPEFAGIRPEPRLSDGATPSIESRECKPNSKFTGITYPMQLLHSPGRLTMIQEEHRRVRRIYLDEELRTNPVPAYYGHSVAHWDDENTLVVQTNGLMGELPFHLSANSDIIVTERIQKIDGGERLRFEYTIDNPVEWSRPARFTVDYIWRPDVEILEFSCEQNSDAFGRGYDSLR